MTSGNQRHTQYLMIGLALALTFLVGVSQTAAVTQPNDIPVVRFDRTENGGPIVDGLQLMANLEKPIYSAEKPIILRLAIYNTLPSPFVLQEDGYGQDLFQVSITDSTGKQVPLTCWGRSLPPPSSKKPESTFARQLFANNVAYYQIVLNREFDLTRSGMYRIRVFRPYIYGNKQMVHLEAKPINLMIVEPDASIVSPQSEIISTPSGESVGPVVEIN